MGLDTSILQCSKKNNTKKLRGAKSFKSKLGKKGHCWSSWRNTVEFEKYMDCTDLQQKNTTGQLQKAALLGKLIETGVVHLSLQSKNVAIFYLMNNNFDSGANNILYNSTMLSNLIIKTHHMHSSISSNKFKANSKP